MRCRVYICTENTEEDKNRLEFWGIRLHCNHNENSAGNISNKNDPNARATFSLNHYILSNTL